MPAPPSRRDADLATALKTMAAEVGDSPLWAVYWRVDDSPELSALLSTTLPELAEAGLVRMAPMMGGVVNWYLTEEGWVRGLEMNRTLREPEFLDRIYRLSAYFKSQIERDEPHEALLDQREVERDAGLPAGWALNVVKSGLLQQLIPDKKMNVRYDESQRVIRVPPTFGMQLL